ncbi:MAG: PAS domain S-box protein [Cyclobacteriaceae bacterium]
MKYHKLLDRQIRKYLQGNDLEDASGLAKLLRAISESYQSYDDDQELSQRAFDLSDQEHQAITLKLSQEKEQRERSISTLLKAIADIEQQSGNAFEYDRTDLYTVTKYLQEQVELRVKAENELKESESNFQQINETIEDVFWLYDSASRKFLYISPSCEKLFGASQLDFIEGHLQLESLVDADDRKVFKEIWQKLDHDQAYDIEYRIKVDGNIKWIHERSFAIRDENQKLIRLSGTYIDITERKLHEEATKSYLKEISDLKTSLEIREEQYRSLVENASDIIYELDGTGKPTYINQVCEPLLGYTNEELYEKHFWEIIPKEYAKEFTAKYLNLIKHKVEYSYLEVPVVKKSGEIVWLGQNTTMFFKGDWLYKASVIARDITVQRKNEDEIQKLSEFQQKILDGTDYGFITTSHPEGIITTFNKGAEAMLGYKADDLVGKATPVIFHDNDEITTMASQLSRELDTIIHPGVDVFHFKVRNEICIIDVNEWTYIRRDGERITVELSITALKDKHNITTGYLGIAKDVTERKKNELEILNAKEQAEVANRVKSEFLANMSHEIRTPLNGVMGFTDLLSKTVLDLTQQKYVSMVSQSADILLDLVNDVLDFAKIEAGKIELDLTNTNIKELCYSVIEMTSPLIKEKRLLQECEVDNDVPSQVLADELRLRQVLVNLMANAVKFTQQGQIKLSVKKLGLSDDQVRIRFSIIDTGLGIHPEHQLKIFEAFSQVDTSNTKKFGGTGLGLSISNNLLSLMDSHIQLESKPGEGSHFYFDIGFERINHDRPVFPKKALHDVNNNIAFDQSLSDVVKQNSLNVLVAEDNMVNMKVIEYIIKKILPNAQIIRADNGLDAVEKFKEVSPSFIFMDIQMPEMNGYEATRQIRLVESTLIQEGKDKIHTPIIALTAGITEGEKEKCFAAGIDDYVSKPVLVNTIRDVLKLWLSNN